jgi:hypothetical protein
LSLATIGFFDSGNNTSLGIRASRTAAGSGWTRSAIGLGMDVDDTVRAGASLWLHANRNVGIGTVEPAAKLHVRGESGQDLILAGDSSAPAFRVDNTGNVFVRGQLIGQRGPTGPAGPPGPPGPAVRTFAVCGPATFGSAGCSCQNVVGSSVAIAGSSCSITSDNGPCSFIAAAANTSGTCCVCRP